MSESRVAAAVAAALLVGGCGGGAARLAPDPLPSTEPSHRFSTVWRSPVSDLGRGYHAFGPVGGPVCELGSGGDIGVVDLASGELAGGFPVGRGVRTGVLCAGGRSFVVDDTNRLVAFGPDGDVLWERRLSGSALGMPVAVPGGESVVVATASGRISSYRASDGEEDWTFAAPVTPVQIEGDQGLVVTQRTLLAGMRNGKLYAINLRDGFDLWDATVAVPTGSHEMARVVHVSPPALSESLACVSSYQGNVACVDVRDGRQVWSRQLSSTKRPALAGSVLCVLDTEDVLHAFSVDSGETVWVNDTMRRRGLSLLGASGGHLLVGDFEGNLLAIDAGTGALAAREGVAGDAIVSAATLPDATLVVRSADGVLARMGLERI